MAWAAIALRFAQELLAGGGHRGIDRRTVRWAAPGVGRVDCEWDSATDRSRKSSDWPTVMCPAQKPPYEVRETRTTPARCFTRPGLVDWAFQLTKDIPWLTPMTQGAPLCFRRFSHAQRAPFVLKGDTLSSETSGTGIMNDGATPG